MYKDGSWRNLVKGIHAYVDRRSKEGSETFDTEDVFRLGDGIEVVSKKKVTFSAVIGKKIVNINANVVSNNNPLLQSTSIMENADSDEFF